MLWYIYRNTRAARVADYSGKKLEIDVRTKAEGCTDNYDTDYLVNSRRQGKEEVC